MLTTKLFHDFRRKNSRSESSPEKKYLISTKWGDVALPEDSIELCIKTTDAHLGKVPIRVDNLCSLDFSFTFPSQIESTPFHLLKADSRVDQEKSTGHFMWCHFFSSLKSSQVGCFAVLKRLPDE